MKRFPKILKNDEEENLSVGNDILQEEYEDSDQQSNSHLSRPQRRNSLHEDDMSGNSWIESRVKEKKIDKIMDVQTGVHTLKKNIRE